MKTKFQMYMQSIAILLVFTLLFSLIFALLYYFNLIHTKTFHILNWIAGILAYGAGGFWLGKNIEKKALLNAFIMALLLGVPALLLAQHDLMGFVECISKLAAYVLVCMVWYSKKKS